MPKKSKSKTSGKGAVPPAKRAEMTDEELAAVVEAYENSEEGRAAGKPAPESRAARLAKLFLKTPDMQECQMTAGTIAKKLDPEDTVAIKIDVPMQFVRLAEFLEEKSAAARGVTPEPVRKVLRQTLENQLHEQLHFLIVQPTAFEYYRNLWNRLCDEQGAPEEKISDTKATARKGGKEGPF